MKIQIIATFASLAVAGCSVSAPPDILAIVDPADPGLSIPQTGYQPIVVDYHHREPTDPQNWRKLNRNLAPESGGG